MDSFGLWMMERGVEWITAGGIGCFGAAANYLHAYNQKGLKFSWGRWASHMVLGFFVGNLIGQFVPLAYEYRDGILLVAGYSVLPILNTLETRGWDIVSRFIKGVGR